MAEMVYKINGFKVSREEAVLAVKILKENGRDVNIEDFMYKENNKVVFKQKNNLTKQT